MRRSETVNIREIINELLKEHGIEEKLSENRLLNSWEELLGKSIANSTKDLYIKNGVLYVSLRSSVVRHELMMIRDELVKRLNEKAGREVITDVVLR